MLIICGIPVLIYVRQVPFSVVSSAVSLMVAFSSVERVARHGTGVSASVIHSDSADSGLTFYSTNPQKPCTSHESQYGRRYTMPHAMWNNEPVFGTSRFARHITLYLIRQRICLPRRLSKVMVGLSTSTLVNSPNYIEILEP